MIIASNNHTLESPLLFCVLACLLVKLVVVDRLSIMVIHLLGF
jgi:hypothetical protein